MLTVKYEFPLCVCRGHQKKTDTSKLIIAEMNFWVVESQKIEIPVVN